jgi:transposase
MAMAIVESRLVTGGVDTHLDAHAAAVLDGNGGLLAGASFPATPAGYRALLEWMSGHGHLERVGVEGTGAYGAGLSRFLRAEGIEVVEVDRPNRQTRRREGKSDPLDAVEAGRAVLSGRAAVVPKTADGAVEAIRALLVVKRSARAARIAMLGQIRQLVITGPDDLRAQLQGVSAAEIAARVAGLRPGSEADTVRHATKLALRTLGRRVLELDADISDLDVQLGRLVTMAAPDLLAVYGVGVHVAAILLAAVGDNANRIRSEAAFAKLCGVAPLTASSGKVTRHRLNRGGNRQANHALWRIVMVRMSSDPRTRAYVERKVAEGRSKPEIIRILKRYVAREVFAKLPRS